MTPRRLGLRLAATLAGAAATLTAAGAGATPIAISTTATPPEGGALQGRSARSAPSGLEPARRIEPVLRVGIVDGAQPCSDQENRQWKGLAVDLWTRLAGREQLPFVFEARPSAASLIADVQRGVLDLGVGCLTVTPERVNSVRFSLPFQEMGLSVMQRRSRREAGEAVLQSLLSRDLLQLLLAYLVSIGALSALLWRCERHAEGEESERHGRRRAFAKVFQILATGPGTNTIASTTRGHGLVIGSYLIRIVTASLLVTTITVKVVQEPQAGATLQRLADLKGVVAARPGSVSEALLQELNANATATATASLSTTASAATAEPIQIVPLPQAVQAPELLLSRRADAVLAEDLQIRYALSRSSRPGLVISLQGLQRESQAFVLSPQLPEATAARINQGLSVLKRSGVVSELQRVAMNKS